ncbi:MAG: Radical SAM domain-containing protein [Parcubacteria group bacterium GW2011_GWA2_38_13]|nr:MAG: Radical SAM domain-containing protein [Parcubacteria group bacterium GW2011_GWA2_38_13]
MLRIGFILPSSEYLYDPFRGDPHTHFQILTVLEQHFENAIKASLIDLRGIKKEFSIYHIPECDVYLYSVYTLDSSEQFAIVKKIREQYPKSIHIAGGPHITVYQEDALKIFDSLILSDGEYSIIQAVEDIIKSSLKKIYEQKVPVDINKFPFPRKHYLPKSAIARKGLMTLKNKTGYDQILGTTVIFSRGCPFACSFCAMPQMRQYAPGQRYRKPELIEEEIEYLKKYYNIRGLNVLDEIAIPYNITAAREHLKAIQRTNIKWRGQCRVDSLTPEMAQLLKDSGCIAMGLGVESASQVSLDYINKKITIEQAKNAIRLLKKYDIEARIYMIIGLPGEPENIFDISWEFIQETDPDWVYLSIFTMRPGTEVFNNPKKFGIKEIKTDWDKTMHMYGRYTKEIPTLSFEYEENAPWGKGLSSENIIKNYMTLQEKLKANGFGPI